MTSDPLKPVRLDPYMSDNSLQNEATQDFRSKAPDKAAKNIAPVTPSIERATAKVAKSLQHPDQRFTAEDLARAEEQLRKRFTDPNATSKESARNSNELNADIAVIRKNNGFT